MKNSLMAELSAWNQLEITFKQVFKEVALEDREFQKMKLREYERISYLYSGQPLSRDERAMQVMLKFQKSKLERKLYPGILRRSLRRVAEFFSNPIDAKREFAMVRQADQYPYSDMQLPVKDIAKESRQQEGLSVIHKSYQAQDVGKRRPQAPKHKHRKGRSL